MSTHDDSDISRRKFVGQSGLAGAGALLATGCKTIEPPGPSDISAASVGGGPIVRAAIHPGIGVARIGNSAMADGFFVGPEVVDPPLTQAGDTRDAAGAIKRQAARFRIYGYNANGAVVRELTAADAQIKWQVHLANKKAAWYRFIAALDMPESESLKCPRRNAAVKGAARRSLVIDPGSRAISGKKKSGTQYRFDGAKFFDTPVSLGELRTDEDGRLLVLGGLGVSGSPEGMPVFDGNDPDTFNNADGWFDDVADGPVTATVTIDGLEVPVEGSWVFVGPPNYAPDVIGWRTLYDLLVDTYVESGMMPFPTKTSFTNDVLPAIRRLSNLQWVNKGFAKAYAKGVAMDFENPQFVAKLARRPTGDTESDPNADLRRSIFNSFRHPDLEAIDRQRWPWIYGDAFGTFENSLRNDLTLSSVRSKHMQRWANGDFIDDWSADAGAPRSLDAVPLAEQPAMLDRAALHFCVADAFHPGCEVTWPMRHASLYRRPFRIKQRTADAPEPDVGDFLTSAAAIGANGPLNAQGPGDLTKWMAVPWQGDTIFCRSGYEPEYDPYLPTFWPARVPNHVLSEADYHIVMDESKPRAERLEAFKRRAGWVRAMTGSAPSQILQMVTNFGRIGVIEARPGIDDDPDLPPVMLVESLPMSFGADTPSTFTTPPEGPDSHNVPRSVAPGRVGEAGWESQEQLEEFRRMRARTLR